MSEPSHPSVQPSRPTDVSQPSEKPRGAQRRARCEECDAPCPPGTFPSRLRVPDIIRLPHSQPVSVVVARLQDGTYHGATLSSFSSIALHPEPLVSFSLRLPSRLADALRRQVTPATRSTPHQRTPHAPYFSINILSGHPACESIAHRFSQAQSNHEAALADPAQWEYVDVVDRMGVGIGQGGIPIARNGMTSLLCQTVRSVALGPLVEDSCRGFEEMDIEPAVRQPDTPGKDEQGSMLFIARVVQVVQGDAKNVLVYKDRRYLSV